MSSWGTPAQIVAVIGVVSFMIWACVRSRKPKQAEEIATPPVRTPEPKERWELKSEGPWRSSSPTIVHILDVKQGWVRYTYDLLGDGRTLRGDYRTTVDMFIRVWVPEGQWPP